ncbi:MAG: isochorismatase family protein [Spirochaetales bacterium]|nr:isochorismatase family protein [Spirochaetales bacterium]
MAVQICKQALLVVDVQNGVISRTVGKDAVLKNINSLIGKARKSSCPVIWVQHSNDELVEGCSEWEFAPELDWKSGDILIPKKYNSSFEDTDLEKTLRDMQVTDIVLTGAQSNWCIRATGYGALERGFNLTLISDAHTTEPIDLPDGTTIEAKGIIAELNIAFSWLRYPGRKCGTAKSDEIQFLRN